jgi:hypothetical protein
VIDRQERFADAGGVVVRLEDWRGDSARSDAQERADVIQNKLANVICNAELALEMVDGPARRRLEAILRAAWTASDIVAALPLTGAEAAARPA